MNLLEATIGALPGIPSSGPARGARSRDGGIRTSFAVLVAAAALVGIALAAGAFWYWQSQKAVAKDQSAAIEEYQSKRAADLAAKKKRMEEEEKERKALHMSAGKVTVVDAGAGLRFEMVWIPRGDFLRGSPPDEAERFNNETLHRAIISKGFWMGRYEVTQAQWSMAMGSNPSFYRDDGGNVPVDQVSWDDCQEFIKKLDARVQGGGFRLPTEAEWEYACRAGSRTAFSYGNSLDASIANMDGNYPYGSGGKSQSRGKTTPVGSFHPNAWGLYDMHGNVWEWCEDKFGDYPPKGPVTDPKNMSSDSLYYVVRGGSFFSNGGHCRSAFRNWGAPSARKKYQGLRLVRQTDQRQPNPAPKAAKPQGQ